MESFNQGASSCNIGALGSVLRRLESNLQCTGVDTPVELIKNDHSSGNSQELYVTLGNLFPGFFRDNPVPKKNNQCLILGLMQKH